VNRRAIAYAFLAGDAALICGAQKAEHYEIASYGSLAAWAGLREENEAVQLLEQNLQKAKATDEKLTEIAEAILNADEESEESEDEETISKRV
jgi:ferritin-like metal-binding protein YciE